MPARRMGRSSNQHGVAAVRRAQSGSGSRLQHGCRRRTYTSFTIFTPAGARSRRRGPLRRSRPTRCGRLPRWRQSFRAGASAARGTPRGRAGRRCPVGQASAPVGRAHFIGECRGHWLSRRQTEASVRERYRSPNACGTASRRHAPELEVSRRAARRVRALDQIAYAQPEFIVATPPDLHPVFAAMHDRGNTTRARGAADGALARRTPRTPR